MILAVDISLNVVDDSSDVEVKGSVVEAEEVICVVSGLSVVDSITDEVRADVVDSLVNDSVV